MGDIRLQFAGVLQEIHGKELFAKVAPVQLYIQDGLVKVLQFPQGEFFGKQAKAKGMFLDALLLPAIADVQDLAVVESHFGKRCHPMPVQFVV